MQQVPETATQAARQRQPVSNRHSHSGLGPLAERATHNHVMPHVDGITSNHSAFVPIADLAHARQNSLYEPHRGIACSRPHEHRTTDCNHIFAASMTGMLPEGDKGQTVRGRA